MRRASALPVQGAMPSRTPRRMPGGTPIATGMRRVAAPVVIVGLLAAALAACGSSSSSSSPAPPGTGSSAANKEVKVSGAFGVSPTVKFPAKAKAGPALYTKTVIPGAGQPLTTSESLVGDFVLYDWKGITPKRVGSTYTSHSPTLFSG